MDRDNEIKMNERMAQLMDVSNRLTRIIEMH